MEIDAIDLNSINERLDEEAAEVADITVTELTTRTRRLRRRPPRPPTRTARSGGRSVGNHCLSWGRSQSARSYSSQNYVEIQTRNYTGSQKIMVVSFFHAFVFFNDDIYGGNIYCCLVILVRKAFEMLYL